MREFLVVTSVSPAHGQGVNGRTLAGFLRTYAGHRAVETCTPEELLAGGPRSARTVFLGMPSPAGEAHLARLRWQHLVLFDLHDHHYPLWDDANKDLLRAASGLYLKCWTDERWDFGIRMGLAPVRRYAKLRLAVAAGNLRRGLGLPAPAPLHDALFLGAATGRNPAGADPALVPNQRISWLLELRDHAPELAVWGGLIGATISPALRERYGDLSRFTLRGKVPFHRYFAALRRSRVALTPEGNAPWSYRHYEAIYARSMLVTCDFRRRQTLVPLPNDGMVHVEDGAPVLPALARALRLREERPEILEENVRFLERFLAGGLYSRRRPELWERFVGQLPR